MHGMQANSRWWVLQRACPQRRPPPSDPRYATMSSIPKMEPSLASSSTPGACRCCRRALAQSLALAGTPHCPRPAPPDSASRQADVVSVYALGMDQVITAGPERVIVKEARMQLRNRVRPFQARARCSASRCRSPAAPQGCERQIQQLSASLLQRLQLVEPPWRGPTRGSFRCATPRPAADGT